MRHECQTIYQRYREASGLTQEYAAELLGVAVRTLAAWETGERTTPDIKVADMCDLYGIPVLAIQHLRLHSMIARETLPAVDALPLPQAVCRFCAAVRDVYRMDAEGRLMRIAADGKVDELEQAEYKELLAALDPIVEAALALRYAREG